MSTPSDSDDEKTLFKNAMKDVKPLKPKHTITGQPKPLLLPRQINQPSSIIHQSNTPLYEDEAHFTIKRDDIVTHFHPHLTHQQKRKLQSGQYARQLDLHGNTKNEAIKRAQQFITSACLASQKCVLIIHGKGDLKHAFPILKNTLVNYLSSHPAVLGFCSAKMKDGGTGALYVLLKSSEKVNIFID